jgi:hypothetical protein
VRVARRPARSQIRRSGTLVGWDSGRIFWGTRPRRGGEHRHFSVAFRRRLRASIFLTGSRRDVRSRAGPIVRPPEGLNSSRPRDVTQLRLTRLAYGAILLAGLVSGSMGCGSSGRTIVDPAGPTSVVVPQCHGGAIAGIEGSLATTHREATPEDAVATFTHNFTEVPSGGYERHPRSHGGEAPSSASIPGSSRHRSGGPDMGVRPSFRRRC